MVRTVLRSLLCLLVLVAVLAPPLADAKTKKTRPKPAKNSQVAKPAPAPAPVEKPVPPPPPMDKLSDAELAAKLHDLVRAKGEYLGVGRDFCIRLGSRPVGNCEVFRAVFSGDGKVVFYSNNDARKNALHLFITSYLESSYVDDFRLGLDGRLERAVRHHGDATSRVDVKDAASNFKRAMDFLRAKGTQLAALPDAKVADDGTCAEGKVKRVPADKEAFCIDRKRLQAPAK